MPTITNANSIFQTGINLSAVEIGPSNTGDPYIVDATGSVISTNGRGIFLNGASETYAVTVNGVVSGLGTNFDGIRMGDSASTATISVGELGRVAGSRVGISLEGGGTITNAGLISGTTDAGILHVSGDASIINTGTIRSGAQGGIHFTNFGSTNTIDNSGAIIAGSNGTAIGSFGDAVEDLTNSGTITGNIDLTSGDDVVNNTGTITGIVFLGTGHDNLTNSGTIAGNIDLSFGDDVVNNTGTITGTVFLADGADQYVGSSGVDIVEGGNDSDNLLGNGGDDQLTGGAGSDQLNGGTGNDTMTGGLDDDNYFVDSQNDIIVEVDGGGTDDAVFASVSYVLAVAAHIESMATVNFNLTTAINLTGNALLGQTIQGNMGNNVLNGGVDPHVDTLRGFAGNDTYVLGASTNDTVTDTAGIDRIESSITRSLASFAAIENLTLTGALAINGTGNALANTITGNGAANILDGGIDALVDTLIGGLGNDSYMIRSATDNITEAFAAVNAVTNADRAKAAVSFTLAAGDNIEFLETVLASAGTAINLTGNEIAQTVIGNAGSNILNGKGGNDTLTGGLGNDFFLFNTALNATTNRDTITDFNVAADTIRLENTGAGLFNTLAVGTLNAAFFKANATGTATDADDRIIYETDTGKLFYDSNGSAAGGSTHFATLSNTVKPVLTNADFFII